MDDLSIAFKYPEEETLSENIMNISTNTYPTKLSSGIILALLALSAFLFLIPFATPVFAANATSPTINFSPNVLLGCTSGTCTGTPVAVTITNPASNQYAITAFTITAPSGWAFSGSSIAGIYFTCTASSTSLACSLTASTKPLPPGAADSISGASLSPVASSSFPVKATFTTSVQDASSAAYYGGKTFYTYSIDPTTTVAVTLSPTSTSFIAGGSPYSVTVTVGGTTSATEAGVPISWTVGGSGSGTVSPSSGTTGSSGTATATFTPTNTATDTNYVIAALGTNTAAGSAGYTGTTTGSSATVTTYAGTPQSVLLTYSSTGSASASSSAFPSNHYEIANNATGSSLGMAEVVGTDVYYSVADAYSNPVTLGVTISSGTITAAAGSFCVSTSVCAATMSTTASSGNFASLTATTLKGATVTHVNYWQSGTYGWSGEITVSLTGTYTVGSTTTSFTGIHTIVNRITTSTWSYTAVTFNKPSTNPTNVAAGSAATVRVVSNPWQQGVPITIQVCTTCSLTTTGYTGGFGSSLTSSLTSAFAGVTNSTGELGTSTFWVDTTAGHEVQFNATWSQTTDSGTSSFTSATPSNAVVTISGSPAKFVIVTGFGTAVAPGTLYVVPGSYVGVDISLSDAYGNPAVAPSSSPQIQIALSLTAGVISATSVYIPATKSSTNATGSFGAIEWTLPSTVGTKATLTAIGVVNGLQVKGSGSVTTVSVLPTLSITSPTIPLNGVIYTNNPTAFFSGEANVSLGYASTSGGCSGSPVVCTTTPVTISSAGIKVGSNAWTSATIVSGTSQVTWNAVQFLSAGLNTIKINATDSNGNVYVTPTITVLVDPTTPTVSFTTANNANLTYGSAVKATIVVAQGDLNRTSVVATLNGTALASSHVAISGTNNPGSSVTYTVTISGLAAGQDTIGLNASSLAGLTGTATAITVTAIVPFAVSIIINSATYGTLGAYKGISVSATNAWSSSQNLVIFAVWKNSAGQTVAVSTGGLTLASGATSTAFAPLVSPLPSGTYTVNVFVITTSNNPVSSTTTTSVSL